MNLFSRLLRHSRLSYRHFRAGPTPPFLVLFINSICNMKCEHCFYWTSLNKRDDLSLEEIFSLSDSLGKVENLNLSGGEPFLRKEFSEVCLKFIEQNDVKQIYVPTNGYFRDRTVQAVKGVLSDSRLELFVVELSLDGMPAFHDEFRVARNSFRKAMETYDALAEIQRRDPRLRIHCISTATDVNMGEIRTLSGYLYERCPQMDHHNLAIIRGDRKNPQLAAPLLDEYGQLYEFIKRLWAPREEHRFGSIVEPMLQWTKTETLRKARQVAPCSAGKMSAVVYANGDVGVCEIHDPIGNLRNASFQEIWQSQAANDLRSSIAAKACHCTTEVFLWPSIVFNPLSLLRGIVKAGVWKRTEPLSNTDRIPIVELDAALPPDCEDLKLNSTAASTLKIIEVSETA